MKAKCIIATLTILVLLSSCGPASTAFVTPTLLPTQQTGIPHGTMWPDIPTPMPFPTLVWLTPTKNPYPTITPTPTPTPYPTARAVKANAVAFVAKDWKHGGPSSLWIANTDGSGETRLVESLDDSQWRAFGNAALKWSPNGKWISYRSADELWIVSPNGLVNKKILDRPDNSKLVLYSYEWSPDSTKIAYIHAGMQDGGPIMVGLVDLATGEISELSAHQSPATVTLAWSPDGHDLLLSNDRSFFLFDVKTRQIVKETWSDTIASNCPAGWYDRLGWSPNGKWFYTTYHGNGSHFSNSICVSGLDGSGRGIYADGTTSRPVWDKTGDFLYFVARKTNPDSDPNLQINEWLMRYDVRTQKAQCLLSLREQKTYDYIQSVSISPDGHMLELHSTASENQTEFILVDARSLSTTRFGVDIIIPGTTAFYSGTAWSPDNQNIIFFAGKDETPNGVGIQPYGPFYALNVKTGKTNAISGNYWVDEWAVSPIVSSP